MNRKRAKWNSIPRAVRTRFLFTSNKKRGSDSDANEKHMNQSLSQAFDGIGCPRYTVAPNSSLVVGSSRRCQQKPAEARQLLLLQSNSQRAGARLRGRYRATIREAGCRLTASRLLGFERCDVSKCDRRLKTNRGPKEWERSEKRCSALRAGRLRLCVP